MDITIFSITGDKKGKKALSSSLFEAPVKKGLMHQALVMQQANRRHAIAHARTRGEIAGSTAKVLPQKGTGRARRGPKRSPIVRGGGKAFGPRSVQNFSKDMPKKMRRGALAGCLSLQAKNDAIIGLDAFPDTIKTKTVLDFLKKTSAEIGRHILFVLPGHMPALALSARNIPGVKSINAAYLNPEDVLLARHIIFVGDALDKVDQIFGANEDEAKAKKAPAKKTESAPKKATKKASDPVPATA